MKKAMIVSTLFITAATSSFGLHAEPSKEQHIGVASGSLIGAAAGGPVGLILGAAFGGLIGDNMHRQEQRLEAAVLQNQNLHQELAELTKVAELASETEQLSGSEMLQMDLLFRTSEHQLSAADSQRIIRLADFLKRYPSLAISLDGFADPRGDQQENLELSSARVESVKQLLISQGINEERVFTTAHGEQSSQAEKGDLDGYAKERRVTIRFSAESSMAEHNVADNR